MLVWILGWLMVLAMALVGTVVTIQNVRGARGPAEQRFVLWSCVTLGVASLGVLALAFFVSFPWNLVVVALYSVAMVPIVYRAAMRRQLIREVEKRNTPLKP